MHDMQTIGLEIYNKGYNIVPVEPNDKRVILKGWSQTERSEANIKNWINLYPSHGIGALTRDTPFIDIDVLDSSIASKIYAKLLTLLPEYFASRTGLWPKTAIPCRNPPGFKPFKKQKSTIYRIVTTKVLQAVEILADGQMVVMAGIHPDTKSPYTWDATPKGNDLTGIPDVKDLPILTQQIIDSIFLEFERLAEAKVKAGIWEVYAPSTRSTESLAPAQIKKRVDPQVKYTREYMSNVLNDIPLQPHDGWLRIGIGLHHQYKGSNEGKDLWKEYSQKYEDEYDEAEIDKRWPTFNPDPSAPGVGIGTVLGLRNQAIAKKNMDPVVFQQEDTTVKAPADKPPNWYEGWYFISSTNEYFKSETGERLKPEAFNTIFAGQMTVTGEKGSPVQHLSRMNLIPSAYLTMYMPGCTRLGTFNNQTYINSYNAHVPTDEVTGKEIPKPTKYTEPKLVIEHIERMIPDDYERSLVLDAMAFIVQNPDKRMHWAPVLLGIPGTGKTTIFEIMQAVLGGQNVKSVSAKQFIGNFNNYAEGSMFNFIEEIYVSGNNRFQSMDNVKEMITNNIITVNRKGVNQYSAKNTASYFLATNRQDALPIDHEDRRYTVIQTILATTSDQFKELYKYITDNPWDITEWLQTHEISADFDPYGKAPSTHSTKAMIQNTTDLLVDKIQEAINTDTPFINARFISFNRLKVVVANSMDAIVDQAFSHKLRTKLIYMNYTRHSSNAVRIGKERHTIFIPNINLHRELQMNTGDYDKYLDIAKAETMEKIEKAKAKVTSIAKAK